MKIKYSDLENAFMYSSHGESYDDSAAYVCTETGEIHYDSEEFAEYVPDDLHNNEKYLAVPGSRELDLGKNLTLKFVSDHLPDELDTVYAIFRSRGAYSRYKAFLADHNCLDQWYRYELAAQREEMTDWGKQNGIEVID